MPDWDEAYDYWTVPTAEEAEELDRDVGDTADIEGYRAELTRLKREHPWIVVRGGGVMTDVDPDQFVDWISRHRTMEEAMEYVESNAGDSGKNEE